MTGGVLQSEESFKMLNQRRVKKRVAVSKQRQITLPKAFCDELGVSDEIFIEFTGNRIVIKPITNDDDFSTEILNELVTEGFEGQQLIQEFEHRKSQIRSAFSKYLEEEGPKAREVSDDEMFGDLVDE